MNKNNVFEQLLLLFSCKEICKFVKIKWYLLSSHNHQKQTKFDMLF